MFAAAILRSRGPNGQLRSVDRNYFCGVSSEQKIIEKCLEDPTIRREKIKVTIFWVISGFQDFWFQTLQ